MSRDSAGIYSSEGDQGRAGTWIWVGVEDAGVLFEEYVKSGAKIRYEPREDIPFES